MFLHDLQEAPQDRSEIAIPMSHLQSGRPSVAGKRAKGDADATEVAVGLGLDRNAEAGGDEPQQR